MSCYGNVFIFVQLTTYANYANLGFIDHRLLLDGSNG